MKKFITAFLVLVFIIGIGYTGYVAVKSEMPSVSYGAASGPDQYNHWNFYLNLTRGGRVATSSAVTAQPLAPYNLKDVSRIDYTPNVVSNTLTLPATSTLTSFVPKVGDTQDVLLCNASTTPGVSFTLAFGAGLKLSQATSTLTVNSTKCAQLEFSRKANSDIDLFYDVGY